MAVPRATSGLHRMSPAREPMCSDAAAMDDNSTDNRLMNEWADDSAVPSPAPTLDE